MSIYRASVKAASHIVPLEKHEWKKFLPMAFMMFFTLFNATVLRSLKDALIVPNIGAEAISFTKLYAVTPCAILFMLVYARMTASLKAQTIFYSFAGFFLVYFVAFTYVLYPYRDIIQPNPETLAALEQTKLNLVLFDLDLAHFKWFIKLYGSWTFVMFYVLAELWTSIMLSLLFWQFANHTTQTSEAKRFYPMFGLIGNIGLIASGFSIQYFASKTYMVDALVMLAAFAVVMIMALYYHINTDVLTDPRYAPVHTVASSKKEKPALSFFEGLKVILSSKYIGLIVVLLLAYGMSINLVEGPWKAKVRELYPTQETYLHFMGGLQKYTGTTTMIIMFLGAHILKRIKWYTGAMLTPLIVLITGTGFFALVVFDKYANEFFGTFANIATLSPLFIAVQLGLWQNATAKGTKYAFFDATKEMAYIPVDKELQTKGKAAADVVASRFAKSFGAVIQSTLFIIFPAATFATITPYLMIIFLVIVGCWIVGVRLLSKEYEDSIAKHKPIH